MNHTERYGVLYLLFFFRFDVTWIPLLGKPINYLHKRLRLGNFLQQYLPPTTITLLLAEKNIKRTQNTIQRNTNNKYK